ncbi:MAG: preprotein translocase subunit YajC [Planctomycetota bacterium]|jgi:preprotein translocase subunit YajC
MKNIWILAEAQDQQDSSGINSQPVGTEETMSTTTVASDPNAGAPVGRSPKSPLMQFLPLIIIFVVMYLLLFRGPRKKQQQHKQMVQTLEKNDKVRTIGGIIGTVVDVKDDEITLKVDESNNTKVKVAASAIGRNLTKQNG